MAIGLNGDLGMPAQEHADMESKLEPGAVLASSVSPLVLFSTKRHRVVHKDQAMKADPALSNTVQVRFNAN